MRPWNVSTELEHENPTVAQRLTLQTSNTQKKQDADSGAQSQTFGVLILQYFCIFSVVQCLEATLLSKCAIT